jgi:hypothetical protein
MLREPIWWVLLVAGVASVFLAIVGALPGWTGGAAVGVLVLVVGVYRSYDARG